MIENVGIHYGWSTRSGSRSAAELYGWVPPSESGGVELNRDLSADKDCICLECGHEFSVQRKGAMYLCDRCVNEEV